MGGLSRASFSTVEEWLSKVQNIWKELEMNGYHEKNGSATVADGSIAESNMYKLYTFSFSRTED
jgi:hypothetical protein